MAPSTTQSELLSCRITVSEEEMEEGGGKRVLLEGIWETGLDRLLFTGFWAHLVRRVATVQPDEEGMDLS